MLGLFLFAFWTFVVGLLFCKLGFFVFAPGDSAGGVRFIGVLVCFVFVMAALVSPLLRLLFLGLSDGDVDVMFQSFVRGGLLLVFLLLVVYNGGTDMFTLVW